MKKGLTIILTVVALVASYAAYRCFANNVSGKGASDDQSIPPGAHREPHYVLVKDETVTLTKRDFAIDLRDSDGQYAIELKLCKLGTSCMVQSHECMDKPQILTDNSNIDVGPKVEVLHLWAGDEPVQIRYKLWAVRYHR